MCVMVLCAWGRSRRLGCNSGSCQIGTREVMKIGFVWDENDDGKRCIGVCVQSVGQLADVCSEPALFFPHTSRVHSVFPQILTVRQRRSIDTDVQYS